MNQQLQLEEISAIENGTALNFGSDRVLGTSEEEGLSLEAKNMKKSRSGLDLAYQLFEKISSGVMAVSNTVAFEKISSGVMAVSNTVADVVGITTPRYDIWIRESIEYQKKVLRDNASKMISADLFALLSLNRCK